MASARRERVSTFVDGVRLRAAAGYGERQVQTTLLLLTLLWCVAPPLGVQAPMVLGWLPGTVAGAFTALAAYRTAAVSELSAPGRRFWRQLGLASALIAPSSGLLAWSTLSPRSNNAGTAAAIPLMTAALLIVIWALLRVPVRSRSRSDWARLALDASTVLVCATTFLWHFAIGPAVHAGTAAGTGGLLWLSLLCTVCLLAVLLVAKLVLAGTDAVDAGALRTLAGVVLLGAIAASFGQGLQNTAWAGISSVVTAVEAALITLAARQQRRYRASRSTTVKPSRRGYSLVPYVAVAAIDALLVATSFSAPADHPAHVLVIGAVTATGIVVLRQVLSFRDNSVLIQSLREHQELLREQATHDMLTTLPNRALFTETLATALRENGNGAHIGVLLIDLDGFKEVNDTLGHAAGDAVLVAVGQRLRRLARASDLAARLGGDEFAILARGASWQELSVLADRVVLALAEPVSAGEHMIRVGASVGLADRGATNDVESLLRNADMAMYEAKRGGKGHYVAYRPLPQHAPATVS